MTLITNKRIYYFELHAEEAKNINAEGLYFAIKFLFPDDQDSITTDSSSSVSAMPDLTDKSLYNFEYTLSGPDIISPIKIFDDGKFTYFEFKDKTAELPAFFHVDATGHEGIVNYRMVGHYLVIEAVGDRFTLRHNKDVVCVYNDKIINQRKIADAKNGVKNVNKTSK